MFRSIRFKLAAWYTATVVLTFSLVAAVLTQTLSTTLSDTLDQSLLSELKWVVERVNRTRDPGQSPLRIHEEIFDHAAYYYTKEYIEIYDTAGRSFYRSPNLESDTLRSILPARPGEDFIMVTVERFRDHAIRLAMQRTASGTVYLAMPTYSISLAVNHLLWVFAWLGPVIIFVSIGGGVYLADKSLRKVNKVIDAAKTITVDRLHDRIPEQQVQDEIGRLISTFNEMISRLDYSFSQMQQFSADASHELRTPLAVMRAQLESVMTNNVSRDEMLETVANCLDETMHMSMLVEHLLLLAKADAHIDVMNRVPLNLGELVRDLHDESTILASHRSVTVSMPHVENLTIHGDAQRLRQMLLNLVDNAIKYNQPNGRIRMDLTHSDGMAVLKVTDTGIGIPREEIPKIFDRFYRVDKARTKGSGGVGLGLSIVKWTVEAHGGRISVESEVNKGTTFTIFLPLVK